MVAGHHLWLVNSTWQKYSICIGLMCWLFIVDKKKSVSYRNHGVNQKRKMAIGKANDIPVDLIITLRLFKAVISNSVKRNNTS